MNDIAGWYPAQTLADLVKEVKLYANYRDLNVWVGNDNPTNKNDDTLDLITVGSEADHTFYCIYRSNNFRKWFVRFTDDDNDIDVAVVGTAPTPELVFEKLF